MNTFAIDDTLEEMAIEGVTHFSPNYVCQRSGINDTKSMTEYLLQQVDTKLKVYFEVECPDGDSDFVVSSPSDIIIEPRTCSVCFEEYTPNPEDIWIAFDFTENYLDHVKKKERNKDNLIMMY